MNEFNFLFILKKFSSSLSLLMLTTKERKNERTREREREKERKRKRETDLLMRHHRERHCDASLPKPNTELTET